MTSGQDGRKILPSVQAFGLTLPPCASNCAIVSVFCRARGSEGGGPSVSFSEVQATSAHGRRTWEKACSSAISSANIELTVQSVPGRSTSQRVSSRREGGRNVKGGEGAHSAGCA